MLPSPAVARIPRTAGGFGGGVGTGVGATVNVHVASSRAWPTAIPASFGDWNTTFGHVSDVWLMHAGMFLVVLRRSRPCSSGPRSFGSRPMPTGSRANDLNLLAS